MKRSIATVLFTAALFPASAAWGQAPSAAALCATTPPTAPGATSTGDLAAGPVTFVNGWAGAGQSSFHHILMGPPGVVRLTLETCSSATGGETIAIYPATAAGQRAPRRARVMFSIAVPRGNLRTATLNIPPAARGRGGPVHLVAVVENASGRFHTGAYRLTIAR